MRELGAIIAIILAVFGFSLLKNLSLESAMSLGWGLVALGLAIGIPTAIIYHILLYRHLQPRGKLPRGWIWRPIGLNEDLSEEERVWTLRWMMAGGFGFVIVVLGLVVLGGSILYTWSSLSNP